MKRPSSNNSTAPGSVEPRSSSAADVPGPASSELGKALGRLQRIAILLAGVIDLDERDPSWHESQELESAAIAYGRLVRKAGA